MYPRMSSGSAKRYGVPLLALVLYMSALDVCQSKGALDVCQSACGEECVCTCDATPLTPEYSLSSNSIALLEEPCSSTVLASLTSAQLHALRPLMLSDLKTQPRHVKDIVNAILDQNVFSDCRTLSTPIQPKTLFADALDKTMEEILQLSLTVHMNYSAHWYFVMEQIESYSFLDCPDDHGLYISARKMAREMLHIVCLIEVFMTSFEGFNDTFIPDITKQITRQRFHPQPDCSRKRLWHCQFLKSNLLELDEVLNFFNRIIVASTSEEEAESEEDESTITEGALTDRVGKNILSVLMKRKSGSLDSVCPIDRSTN